MAQKNGQSALLYYSFCFYMFFSFYHRNKQKGTSHLPHVILILAVWIDIASRKRKTS